MVSLEIPYYPCMFGQTKSVPGIKYRILGDGKNNYYESFKSVWPYELFPCTQLCLLTQFMLFYVHSVKWNQKAMYVVCMFTLS